MTETILLPCPWCGKADAIAKDLARGAVQFERLVCDRCGAQGPPAYEGHDAAVLWNARVGSAQEAASTDEGTPENGGDLLMSGEPNFRSVWDAQRIARWRAVAQNAQIHKTAYRIMYAGDVLSLLDELEHARTDVRIKNAELSLASEQCTKYAIELAKVHAKVDSLRKVINQPVPDDEYWR